MTLLTSREGADPSLWLLKLNLKDGRRSAEHTVRRRANVTDRAMVGDF